MKSFDSHRVRLAFWTISALLFAAVLTFIETGTTDALDQWVRTLTLVLNSPITVEGWKIVTFLGSTVFLSGLLIVALALLAIGRHWGDLKFVAVVALGAVALDVGSKLVVHRPRPPEVYAHTMPTSFSFPSGHAFYSLLFYMLAADLIHRLVPNLPKLALYTLASILVLAIGASRLFLGVHYLTDVAGGYLLALVWLPMATAIRSLNLN